MSAGDEGRYRIGVDVGGTFTDLVLARPDGSIRLEKSPTTPDDQSDGVLAGLELLADGEGLSLEELLAGTATIVHGTTTGDNTMIQMNGARAGLICSQGFRDEMDIRRGYKEDIWDAALPAPEPIAKRRVRISVPERLDPDGNVVVALDEEAVRKATARLRGFGVESIAISFLHSYVNPVHELRARDIVRDEYPDVTMVTLSHEVLPRAPEFERTSTAVVNAYVGPVIARYVHRLERRLRDAGLAGELLIARSNGGVCLPSVIERRAVATIGSGPTGGAVAAATAAAAAGLGDVISVDMGGTSYDVCLVRDGRPEVKTEWNWRHRYLIQLPMVDVQSVGAGGGSIARVAGERLLVGPQSAGAVPGPVAYGLGGTEPTVTDADLVLGRIDPARFAAGRRALDLDAAAAALDRLGAPLGLSVVDTAVAIVDVIDAYMTDAVRRVCALAGADARAMSLVAFGGMGPVHATTQAAALGMRRCLVPLTASGFSAFGLLMADQIVDESRAYLAPSAEVDLAELTAAAERLDAAATTELREAGVPDQQIGRDWFLNMVFPGQTFDVSVPLARTPGAPVTAAAVADAVEEFHRRNAEARLIESRAEEPLVRGIRLVATGHTRHPDLAPPEAPDVAPAGGRRPVHLGGDWVDADVVDVAQLTPGAAPVVGPAVVELAFSSLLLRPGDSARAVESGDILVDLVR
ncbi:MAG TPA: hydantoinase/oxoprolinase family protein [Acidimicrobiia bacterium]|nr:hydantoinase/oxoprolinase family protein [Acidimicrobiia bacterium]